VPNGWLLLLLQVRVKITIAIFHLSRPPLSFSCVIGFAHYVQGGAMVPWSAIIIPRCGRLAPRDDVFSPGLQRSCEFQLNEANPGLQVDKELGPNLDA
jgi:hypothetical protein